MTIGISDQVVLTMCSEPLPWEAERRSQVSAFTEAPSGDGRRARYQPVVASDNRPLLRITPDQLAPVELVRRSSPFDDSRQVPGR
jgi:hypothetical protein